MRIICGISWVLVIPMFFVPEPKRNETNRLGAKELESALEAEVNGEDDAFNKIRRTADESEPIV